MVQSHWLAQNEGIMLQTKILVVDDEPDLMSLLEGWLQEEGYVVFAAGSGEEALRLFFQHRPDLSITDLRMPGMNGFQLITRIRELSDGHILVLTALGGEDQMIQGLELGADDYLVKPVSKNLLLTRVRTVLRRPSSGGEAMEGYSDDHLSLNFLTREVWLHGRLLNLGPTEFRLLAFLTSNNSRVVGHQELLDRVWGHDGGSLDSLKWYIHL